MIIHGPGRSQVDGDRVRWSIRLGLVLVSIVSLVTLHVSLGAPSSSARCAEVPVNMLATALQPNAGASLPVTEQVAERVIVVPTGTAVTKDDIRVATAFVATMLVA